MDLRSQEISFYFCWPESKGREDNSRNFLNRYMACSRQSELKSFDPGPGGVGKGMNCS